MSPVSICAEKLHCCENEYSHCGDLGDVIFSLATVKALGGADTFYLHDHPGKTTSPMSPERVAMLKPLIESQDYIRRVIYSDRLIKSDLDGWRDHLHGRNILTAHASTAGLAAEQVMFGPWLAADVQRIADVVIARTPRAQGANFPWLELLAELDRRGLSVVFLGLEEEHGAFCHEVREVRYRAVRDFQDAAEVINGSRLYCGVQTAMHAIADGLGKPILREAPKSGDNCQMMRENLLSIYHNESWSQAWLDSALAGTLTMQPLRSRIAVHQYHPRINFHLAHDPHQQWIFTDIIGNDPYGLRDVLPSMLPPSLVFDVGGYIGLFGACARYHWPHSIIVVFEPNLENSELIHLNCPDAIHVPFALGRRGYFDYQRVAQDSGSNHLVGNGDAIFRGGVRSIRLADAISLYGTPDLLKIDCEGGEQFMIADIAHHRIPTIVGEYHEGPRFLDLLRDAGYDVVRHWPIHPHLGTFIAQLRTPCSVV